MGQTGAGSAGFWSPIHLGALGDRVCAVQAVQEDRCQFRNQIPVNDGLGIAVDGTLQSQPRAWH